MTDTTRPVTICVTYKLSDGITLEAFRRWSGEIDQPACLRLPGISRYEIYEVTDVEDGDSPPDIIDIVEAESWEAWLAVDQHPSMTQIVEDFFSRVCQPDSVRTYRMARIPPSS